MQEKFFAQFIRMMIQAKNVKSWTKKLIPKYSQLQPIWI